MFKCLCLLFVQVCLGGGERSPSMAGTSAFLSKTERNAFCPNKDMPSPCNYLLPVYFLLSHAQYQFIVLKNNNSNKYIIFLSCILIITFLKGHYEVNDNSIHKGPKVAVSPFKSKTPRIPAPLENRFPGPGAYSPHQTPAPVKRTILPWANLQYSLANGFESNYLISPKCLRPLNCLSRRGHYLAISAPALIVPKDPPSPGPGQYDILKRYSSSKHPTCTAAFASRTERILQDPRESLGPGPGKGKSITKWYNNYFNTIKLKLFNTIQ